MKAPSRRGIGALARLDLLERRRTGLGASLFVQPAVLLLVLVMSVVVPSLSGVKLGEGRRTVAVRPAGAEPGSAQAGRALLAEVVRREPRFVLVEVADVDERVASEHADTGVTFDEAGRARVVALPFRRTSRVAAAELTGALRSVQLEQAGAAAPTIERRSLKSSGLAGRISLAGLLPFLVAFQLLSLVGDASTRIRGGKTDRSAEAFHVLPVSRLDLVLGRGVVGVAEGVVRLGAMLLIAAALPLVPSSVATFSLPLPLFAALAVAGVCQLVVATAAGSLLGALVRTAAQEGVVQGAVSLGLSLGFVTVTVASPGPLPGSLALVPFLGPTMWVRNAFYGVATPVEPLLAIAVSVATAALCVVLAARALDRDGVTLREA